MLPKTREAKTDKNKWFGHTTSLTPHLVPNCEVKSGQATSSTALGDLAGTGCAERFSFSACLHGILLLGMYFGFSIFPLQMKGNDATSQSQGH